MIVTVATNHAQIWDQGRKVLQAAGCVRIDKDNLGKGFERMDKEWLAAYTCDDISTLRKHALRSGLRLEWRRNLVFRMLADEPEGWWYLYRWADEHVRARQIVHDLLLEGRRRGFSYSVVCRAISFIGEGVGDMCNDGHGSEELQELWLSVQAYLSVKQYPQPGAMHRHKRPGGHINKAVLCTPYLFRTLGLEDHIQYFPDVMVAETWTQAMIRLTQQLSIHPDDARVGLHWAIHDARHDASNGYNFSLYFERFGSLCEDTCLTDPAWPWGAPLPGVSDFNRVERERMREYVHTYSVDRELVLPAALRR